MKKQSDRSLKRLHILYSGRVQGVGFRYMAEHMACELGIRGWVKNLADGKVEVVAEGDEALLSDFLSRIKNRMRNYINHEDIVWQQASGEFRDFDIRFF